MCNKFLSNADINAIAKNRGFSKMETKTRKIFQNYFLSDIGLEKAISSLSIKEQIFLHFLTFSDKSEDISVFEKIYPVNNSEFEFLTTTQEYKETYKIVLKNLIRKGVIIVSEKIKSKYNLAKMERVRFTFPEEFVPFLPSIIHSIVKFENPHEKSVDIIRKTLVELTVSKNDYKSIHMQNNEIKIESNAFNLKNLKKWQFNNWGKKVFERDILYSPHNEFIDKCKYIFSQLKPDEWFLPKDFQQILDVFCYKEKIPSVETICQLAWESGFMRQYNHKGKTYYAIQKDTKETDLSPDEFIKISKDQSLIIDLNTIPYSDLEQISMVSDFKRNRSQLCATPNFLKFGKHWNKISDQPIFEWLIENSDLYKELTQSIEKKRGKCLVHKNLCVARIKDLSLRVKIEKVLSDDQVKVLSDEYIAFPINLTSQVETLVKKAGFVVKNGK